ncbi:MAG: hypothetical protein KC506_02125 [Nanoarchaeota archaeon]|nr:hypothetical protein [Nanoarchaeota archaeon]
MISTKNLQQAKNQIKTTKGRPIIVKAQDSEFNRKILEYGKFDVLLDVHDTRGIDRLRQLDSGLNHVIARIAAKNEVAIGIDLERIRNLNGKMKAEFLGRIRQNIKICRKAKVKIRLVNFIDDLDAKDFLVSLGASTSQASGAI